MDNELNICDTFTVPWNSNPDSETWFAITNIRDDVIRVIYNDRWTTTFFKHEILQWLNTGRIVRRKKG